MGIIIGIIIALIIAYVIGSFMTESKNIFVRIAIGAIGLVIGYIALQGALMMLGLGYYA